MPRLADVLGDLGDLLGEALGVILKTPQPKRRPKVTVKTASRAKATAARPRAAKRARMATSSTGAVRKVAKKAPRLTLKVGKAQSESKALISGLLSPPATGKTIGGGLLLGGKTAPAGKDGKASTSTSTAAGLKLTPVAPVPPEAALEPQPYSPLSQQPQTAGGGGGGGGAPDAGPPQQQQSWQPPEEEPEPEEQEEAEPEEQEEGEEDGEGATVEPPGEGAEPEDGMSGWDGLSPRTQSVICLAAAAGLAALLWYATGEKQ